MGRKNKLSERKKHRTEERKITFQRQLRNRLNDCCQMVKLEKNVCLEFTHCIMTLFYVI